jgi:hypothetical protein
MKTADLPPCFLPLSPAHESRRAWPPARSPPSRSRRRGVEGELVALQRLRRDVHADGRVAGARSVDRHAVLVRGGEQRLVLNPSLRSRSRTYLPQRLWNSAVDIGFWNSSPSITIGERRRRCRAARVVEEDVVDAHDLFAAQHDVGDLRVALMQREPDAEVRVVVEVRARRDDPVNEARR